MSPNLSFISSTSQIPETTRRSPVAVAIPSAVTRKSSSRPPFRHAEKQRQRRRIDDHTRKKRKENEKVRKPSWRTKFKAKHLFLGWMALSETQPDPLPPFSSVPKQARPDLTGSDQPDTGAFFLNFYFGSRYIYKYIYIKML